MVFRHKERMIISENDSLASEKNQTKKKKRETAIYSKMMIFSMVNTK